MFFLGENFFDDGFIQILVLVSQGLSAFIDLLLLKSNILLLDNSDDELEELEEVLSVD
jgi:hypothetical protein